MFWPPENVTFFHSKLLLYNCKFYNINDEQLDTTNSLLLLMLTMLPSLCLISSKQTVSSRQCFCCSTGLKLSWPKRKLQNVGAGDPSSTIIIDHGSHAVLPMTDRLRAVVPFLHSILLLNNSASFTSSRMKDSCEKWKKLMFRCALNSEWVSE